MLDAGISPAEGIFVCSIQTIYPTCWSRIWIIQHWVWMSLPMSLPNIHALRRGILVHQKSLFLGGAHIHRLCSGVLASWLSSQATTISSSLGMDVRSQPRQRYHGKLPLVFQFDLATKGCRMLLPFSSLDSWEFVFALVLALAPNAARKFLKLRRRRRNFFNGQKWF